MVAAYIHSSHSNAYGIYIGLRSLGIDASTRCVAPAFPIPYSSKAADANDWNFFTDEASLQRALNSELEGNFFPRIFPRQFFDNKWEIVEWINSKAVFIGGPKQWDLSKLDQLHFPCVLKSKHSWQHGLQLPRGWICWTKDDVPKNLGFAQKFDGWNDLFFFQEWLGGGECRVVSVCGYHDSANSARNLSVVVERLCAHTNGLSGSAAIESISDEWELRFNSEKLLGELNFTGPYEIEYLVSGKNVFFLELNPRFWMQHTIFLPFGNGLIKRYMGLDTSADLSVKSIGAVVWVDAVNLLIGLIRFDFKLLMLYVKKKYFSHSEVVLWPPMQVASQIVLKMVLKKMRKLR